MTASRVTVLLPELPSDEALELARTIQELLSPAYLVNIRLTEEDDDTTPIERRYTINMFVLRIEEKQ